MSSEFNNIKTWMVDKLTARGMSTNHFVVETGYRITNASLFRWYSGRCLPSSEKMAIVCETLSGLPVLIDGVQPWFEEVHLSEGMSQFSPRARTALSKSRPKTKRADGLRTRNSAWSQAQLN